MTGAKTESAEGHPPHRLSNELYSGKLKSLRNHFDRGLAMRDRNGLAWIGAIAITLAACALVHDHTRMDSASFDELSHIHAAYLQVFHHSAISNMEHPPLAKEVAGLGLLFVHP